MKFSFIIFVLLMFAEPASAGDAIPVTRVNVTDAAESKIVDIITTDNVDRLTVDVLGNVVNIPGGVDDFVIVNAENAGSASLIVDGGTTPVVFSIAPHATKETFISTLRFYGGCNGIKFTQFLCDNSALTNGIEIKIKSNNNVLTLPLLFTTEDFKNKFAISLTGESFRIDIQPGSDQFLAILHFNPPIVLKPQGAFGGGNDDYIQVKIQDNLTAGGFNLSEFEFSATGFRK